MHSLVQILYLLSSGLFIPVVLLLLAFVLWSMLEAGGFLREYRERRRNRVLWQTWLRRREADPDFEPTIFFDTTAYPGLLGLFSRRTVDARCAVLQIEKNVADLEIEASNRLSRMSLGIRLAPMLGLMGTLIPLGPALVGLSSGNLAAMTENLVVAFSTTVLGLLVGGVCYGIWLARRQWYAQDLADIEFLCRCLTDTSSQIRSNDETQPSPWLGSSPAACPGR